MSNYKWTIVALECLPTLGEKTNYVITCHWRYGVSNGDDPSAEGYIYTDIFGSQSFQQDDTAVDFTPYEELTEAQVIGWLEAAMNVPSMQAGLDDRLDRIINPPIIQPRLPWIPAPEVIVESDNTVTDTATTDAAATDTATPTV